MPCMLWIVLAACSPKSDDSVVSDDSANDSQPVGDSGGDDDSAGCKDPVAWFADHDGDGFGLDGEKVLACDPPDGTWVLVGTDCDDTSAAVNPNAQEVCDPANVDEDCDGVADDADDSATGQGTYYTDADGDGYGALPEIVVCNQPGGSTTSNKDCDDTDPNANPGASEVCGGGDEDCDGETDEAGAIGKIVYWKDADGDGFGNAAIGVGSCTEPSGYVTNDFDCDDTNALANPFGIEICAVGDEDCDGVEEEEDDSLSDATTWYYDGDGDGYGGSSSTVLCAMPSGYVAVTGDCADSDAAINPGASEVCDASDVDEDCDTLVDEDDPSATGC
jgi:hypothetical protein